MSIEYGSHTLIGDHGDSYFSQTPLAKALIQGWSEGCPVAIRLTKEPTEGGRGAENMIPRYGAVNFWFGVIAETFQEGGRQDLLSDLQGPKLRLAGEPMREHDLGWPPTKLEDYILNTAYGYSLPRLIVSYILSPKEGQSIAARQERMRFALQALENLTAESANITDFLIYLTEKLAARNGDGPTLLKTMLPQGKLNEDNCYTEYRHIVQQMQLSSPTLWELYTELQPGEKAKLGMADIQI